MYFKRNNWKVLTERLNPRVGEWRALSLDVGDITLVNALIIGRHWLDSEKDKVCRVHLLLGPKWNPSCRSIGLKVTEDRLEWLRVNEDTLPVAIRLALTGKLWGRCCRGGGHWWEYWRVWCTAVLGPCDEVYATTTGHIDGTRKRHLTTHKGRHCVPTLGLVVQWLTGARWSRGQGWLSFQVMKWWWKACMRLNKR